MEHDEQKLKLGILGLSEGNGHPYSWSAIFNGYDPEAMRTCPFPVIPEYLGRQRFPDDSIAEATVTHIWTQERTISEHVARASRIPNVVDRYEDMIGQVDGILLARDDAENHLTMSEPFLRAGLPVYIDKPLALTRKEADRIYLRQKYDGQIFTCSALAFSKELMLTPEDRARLGSIGRIEGSTMKDWPKYSPHIIEPVLNIIGDQGAITDFHVSQSPAGMKTVEVAWETDLETSFSALGPHTRSIEIIVIGDRSLKRLVFADSFGAFKAALQAFIDGIQKRRPPISREFVMKVISIIEAGMTHE
ncbi:MAG: hypothetical protein PHR28_03480 [candidate division Zixibacteria bacterium]|nr:hypothetical protein [candidate division Zixibacteria bacterium]